MLKRIKLAPILLACLILVACQPIENNARDTAAALQGVIVAAQAKHHDACVGDPSQAVCQLINKGVAGQNALITSLETYCGWSTTAPPPDQNTKCVPVKGAEAALKSAIANAAQLTVEIRGTI